MIGVRYPLPWHCPRCHQQLTNHCPPPAQCNWRTCTNKACVWRTWDTRTGRGMQ